MALIQLGSVEEAIAALIVSIGMRKCAKKILLFNIAFK